MNINKSVWVLITGNIRDTELVGSRFDFLISLKEQGLISGVVFSTWVGELEKSPILKDKMVMHDFILVESEAPSVLTRGNLVHQMIQLEHGLALCPDDCFVLKIRTDKCGPNDGFCDEVIVNSLVSGNIFKPCDYDRAAYTYKIGTLGGHTNGSTMAPVLFFFMDRWYFGYKKDLERLVSYHVLSLDFESLIPEQALFLKFFQPYWSCLKYFPSAINQDVAVRNFLFEKCFSDKDISELTDFLLSKKLFRMAILAERWILSTHFFDFNSTLDIGFNSCYRGFDLLHLEELEQIKSQAFYDPLPSEIDEIAGYLYEKLFIPKVRSMRCLDNGVLGVKFEERKTKYINVLSDVSN